MAQWLRIHPDNPQPRALQQATVLLQQGGVLAVPTDSSYALVCHLDDKQAIDRMRRLRGVDKVALVGWSQGGPRTAGYAAQNPAKISKLVVLAPAYNRDGASAAPNPFPKSTGPVTVQSRGDRTGAEYFDCQIEHR